MYLLFSPAGSVELANDCPSGQNITLTFVKVDTAASCGCRAVGNDSLTRHVQWFKSNGQAASGSSLTSATLNFTARVGESYTCSEIVNGGRISNLTFSPHVAYGPSSVEWVLTGGTYAVCPGVTPPVLKCQTPVYDPNQPPWFLIYRTIDQNTREAGINLPNRTADGLWGISTSIEDDEIGQVTRKCRASNMYFRDMFVENVTTILVQRPSSSPPVIRVDGAPYINGSSFTTTENVPRHIACTVSGGEPNVYAITFTCGQHIITEYGNTADLLQTTFSKAENGQKCTCSASHVTGCYNLRTEITISVRYQPTVTSFTAVGKDTEVTIKQGDTINFNCTASANPRPTMYITQRSPTSEPFITVQTYNLQYDIRGAQCDDTDVFYCVADNSVTSGAQATKQRSIQVYVTCPPQPIKSGEQTHTVNLNSDATIKFDVTAYPVINTSLAVLSVVKEKFLVPVDATRYNVSVVPGVPPKMTVVVTFKKVQQEDLLHYAVDLQNGVGSRAAYYFDLTEPEDQTPMYIGIGVGVGGAVLLIIVVLVIVEWKKSKKSKLDASKGELVTGDTDKSSRPDGSDYNQLYPPTGLYDPPKHPNPSVDDDYIQVEDHYDYIPDGATRVDYPSYMCPINEVPETNSIPPSGSYLSDQPILNHRH
ncbi:uncharacterized protein LOC131948900 [Physella acuta]|uniref:uncharacterized protein LOC131948900 n=1 Tax=Physella acuta TaxID=109671 RepID=UPI0027DBDBE8|nr:uncharacterized protein LOC131948900 [Physella acuta]